MERKKNGKQAIGKRRGGWNAKIPVLTAGDRRPVAFGPSGGNEPDATEGRVFLKTAGTREHTGTLLPEKAYEDERPRVTARELRYTLVAPPKRKRVRRWEYDKELSKRRKEEEGFFRRLKGFRGICTRYDKPARIFSACIYLACICIALPCVNTPHA
jgi:transposase